MYRELCYNVSLRQYICKHDSRDSESRENRAIEVAFLDRLPRYKDSIIIFIKCRVYGRDSMTYIYYWNHVLRFFASVACLRFRVGQ